AGGGLEGLADELANNGISPFDLLLQLVVFVSIAFMGVGIGVRRDLSATLERLGIRLPTMGDWVWGGITALLCLALLVAFSVWNQAFNPSEITDQQTIASDQLMVALGQSYAMAGLAALSAGVGEEVLFRGALQPIFGILPTAIFFGLLHSQYLFTPLLILVIMLGCVMGILRRLRNTTSAIIAHFSYNFIQLALFIWVNNLTTPSALSGLILLEKAIW
ncbi:MAG: CPBP family intramembrane glutamic endopeptidase, partial [Phototrophicaceae bacterium]